MSISLPPKHMDDPLRSMAVRDPQAVACITPERTLTYAELDRIVSATSQHLRAFGYHEGDCVAWYVPTGWQALVLLCAAIRAGVVTCPLRSMAVRDPQAVACITPERTLTYAELDRIVSATSQHLRTLGYHEGDCLAWYVPTGWQALVLLCAAIRAGVVSCPLSTRLPPKGVATKLQQVRARTLVTGQVGLAGEIAGDVVLVSPDEMIRDAESREEEQPLLWEMHRSATVVFTSGSSGTPKAGLHSLGNHVFNAMGSNENIALVPGDRWLLALPLYHVGGLGIVFRCLLAGATMVVPEPGLDLSVAIARYHITHVSLVATQLGRLLQEPQAEHALKAVLLGGSAIPRSLLAEAHARGLPIHTTYGLTEMASQVTTTPPKATLDQLQSSGQVLPYRRIEVADDGEILVQGATLFQGYLDGETVYPPFDKEGWFHTGDLGWLGVDGFLYVQGRTDNLFISGGENIQPEEVEQALCNLPGVVQAVVVPVDDAEFGQRPVAFVRGTVPLDILAAQLEVMLPRYKIPLAFYPWPEREEPMKSNRGFFRQHAERLRKE